MQLKYFVPFKAQEGVDAQFALKEKLLNIEGIAIDTSVNLNKWQVPEEDLDYFATTLIGAQLRVDHAEAAMAVIGKVPEGKRVGNTVAFRAEVGDVNIIEKIIRGYLSHVSVQVDSEDVECSKCQRPTRKEGVLVHLCPGAWEIVHKPKVRELSIVASPAYQNTSFVPVGFAAAMDEAQINAAMSACAGCEECTPKMRARHMACLADGELSVCGNVSRLLNGNKNVGSRLTPQEPENKTNEPTTTEEVKHLAEQNGQQAASPHTASGKKAQVVNVGPGESAPKQVDYAPFLQQLQDMEKQITQAEGAEADAEIDVLKKKIAKLESDIAKKATKRSLSRKLSELSKKISEEGQEAEEGEEGEEGGNGGNGNGGNGGNGGGAEESEEGEEGEEAEASQASKSPHAAGKGIVAPDELPKDSTLSGPNYDWFNKDLLRAHSKLVGHK